MAKSHGIKIGAFSKHELREKNFLRRPYVESSRAADPNPETPESGWKRHFNLTKHLKRNQYEPARFWGKPLELAPSRRLEDAECVFYNQQYPDGIPLKRSPITLPDQHMDITRGGNAFFELHRAVPTATKGKISREKPNINLYLANEYNQRGNVLSIIEDKKQGGIFFEQNNGRQIVAAFTNVLEPNRDSLLEAVRDKNPWDIKWKFGASAHVGKEPPAPPTPVVPTVEERFCGVTLTVKPEETVENAEVVLYNHRHPEGIAIDTPIHMGFECQEIMESGGTVFYSLNKRNAPQDPVPVEHLDTYQHEGSLVSVIVDKKQNGVFFEQHIGRGTKSCFTNALKGQEKAMLDAIAGKKTLKVTWEHNTEPTLSQQAIRTTPTYFR